MFSNKFRITIVSLPDREELVAEIFYDHDQWVEISQEPGVLAPIIQFYSPRHAEYWEFSLEEALSVLEKAKKRFLEIRTPRVG